MEGEEREEAGGSRVVEQQEQEDFGLKVSKDHSGGNLEDKNVYSGDLLSESPGRTRAPTGPGICVMF